MNHQPCPCCGASDKLTACTTGRMSNTETTPAEAYTFQCFIRCGCGLQTGILKKGWHMDKDTAIRSVVHWAWKAWDEGLACRQVVKP